MNTPQPDPDQRWDALLQRARGDTTPPTNTDRVLRSVRQAGVEPASTGWFAEFATLFSVQRAIPACLAMALVISATAAWQVWDLWQALPWAELIGSTTGGAP